MNETDNIPADWVLLEAARVGDWPYDKNSPDKGIGELREDYNNPISRTYRALCDKIAEHEQPPVDPDVEAVKRIIGAWYGYDRRVFNPEKDFLLDRLARAVAQYKQERGNV